MRLSDCFIDIIAYVSYFTLNESDKSYDQIRHEIFALLTDSKEKAEKNKVNLDAYEKAEFAICSWIDESIMESPWKHKTEWQKNLLQTKIFKTSDGGLLFFDRLNQLRPDENDVREVYFLCIALGFTGVYGLKNNDFRLEELKSTNSRLLTGSAMGAFSIEGKTLFPAAYHEGAVVTEKKRFKRNRSYLMGAVFMMPLLVLGVMFFLYNFILNSEIAAGLVF